MERSDHRFAPEGDARHGRAILCAEGGVRRCDSIPQKIVSGVRLHANLRSQWGVHRVRETGNLLMCQLLVINDGQKIHFAVSVRNGLLANRSQRLLPIGVQLAYTHDGCADCSMHT